MESNRCIMPFTHLNTRVNGEIMQCAQANNVIGHTSDGFNNVWNAEALRTIRKDMLNGIRTPACVRCWENEDLGITSMRQKRNAVLEEQYGHKYQKANADGTMRDPVIFLEIRLSNLCNLKCRMCKPCDSTRWYTEYWNHLPEHLKIHVQDDNTDGFFAPLTVDDYDEVLPHVQKLHINGGEPLINPMHYQLLDKLKGREHEVDLYYNTNFQDLGVGKYTVMNYWHKFKSVTLAISQDGPPLLNDYIRAGGTAKQVAENIQTVRKEFTNIQTMLMSFCTSAMNIWAIGDAARYALVELDMPFQANRVHGPKILRSSVLPAELKEKVVMRLDNWLDVDLREIMDLVPNKTRVQRAAKFVHDMKTLIQQEDNSELWDQFCQYMAVMDRVNKTDIRQAIPLYGDYLK